MKTKLILIFLLSICFSFSMTAKNIPLSGKVIGNIGGPLRSEESIETFVSVSIENAELNIDFFGTAEDVTIELYDVDGYLVFSHTMDVIDGSNITINLFYTDSPFFELVMYNDDIDLSGIFSAY